MWRPPLKLSGGRHIKYAHSILSRGTNGLPYIHTMVPCDTLTPRALRVTAHATCQWVLVRFELAIFGSQAERSNHYTSVAAYILQCSFIPCVLVVLSITPRAIAIARGVIDSTPRGQVRMALYHRPVCGGVDQRVGRCNQVRVALLRSKQCDIFQYNTFLGALGPTHSVFGQLRR